MDTSSQSLPASPHSTLAPLSVTQGAPEKTVPALREDLSLYPGTRAENGAPSWVLHDPANNRFFSIGPGEFALLTHWHLATATAILASARQTVPQPLADEQLDTFIQFLEQNQLVQAHGAESRGRLLALAKARQRSVLSHLVHGYLFFRIPLFHPDKFLSNTLWCVRPLYTREFAFLMAALAIVGAYLTVRQWPTFTRTFDYFFSLEGLLYYAAALAFAKTVHELGHAYTAKLYGLRVPTMGIAFLVMWPVLYTDTTEAYKLTSRRQRLSIGAAGVTAELCLAVIATVAWTFLPDGPLRSAAFFVAAVSWVITVTININPFMRWDGYYLLADFLGIQNLQERGFAYARWALREWLFDMRQAPPEHFSPKLARILLVYSYTTWIYRLILFLGIAVLVYYLFFKLAGIVLMIIELTWFIGRPVTRELKVWYAMRGSLRWNAASRRTLLLLIALGLAVVLPWRTAVEGSAVLRDWPHTDLYAPRAARLEQLALAPGQLVHQGDVLLRFASPELAHELTVARLRVDMLEQQLAREGTSDQLIRRRIVLFEALAEARTELSGLQDQHDKLVVTAPFTGRIADLSPAMHEGRWVNQREPIAALIGFEHQHITAYFTQADSARIGEASEGTFYPEPAHIPPFPVTLIEADPVNVPALSEPYAASLFGGAIAAYQDDTGGLIPHEAVYRLRFVPANPLEQLQRVVRGKVVVKAEPQSLWERAWNAVLAVLIRESGF